MQKSYDYIILGAGCAGLSLLMRMIDSGQFADKRILLIDKEPKTKNDRTWCFWEKEKGFFEKIVYRKWDGLVFRSDNYSSLLDIAPYKYKMIQGIDFYNYCFSEINKQENVDVIYDEIKSFDASVIQLANQSIKTGDAIVFNSLYQTAEKKMDKFYLLQHFKGWIIETKKNSFNPGVATLMDFRVHQDYGTTFVYTLPLNERAALVEYTLFTESLLNDQQYEEELKIYVKEFLKIDAFKVIDEEFGVIPMTNEQYSFYANGVYNTGTAGGQTKPSTGYTFQFIQKQVKAIVDALINKRNLSSLRFSPKRFQFYDSTLLHLLAKGELSGKEIFTRMFKKNKAEQVFKFLDNETSLSEEIKIMSTLQIGTFFKAGVKEFLK
ncbi:MAG: lycopene cyclase [Sphingobacteriales bacterium]|nr:lycopene cyclase [Sphingobacteriales bacterium]MBI3718010.1 lycopene cyclase [Sphingobacteriales bacterium]